MFTYRKIFKAAWDVTRHNPVLWLLAFAVAFIGTSGEVGILISSTSLGAYAPDESLGQVIIGSISESGFLSGEMMRLVSGTIVQKPILFLMFLVVMTLVVAALVGLVWLIIVFQGALIAGIYQLLDKQEPRWQSALATGVRRFWQVLGLNIVGGVTAAITFGLLRIFALMQFPGSSLVFIVLFIVLMLALIATAFVVKFALFGTVVHSQGIREAWRNGLQLFRKNWLVCSEIALFLFFIYVASTALISYVTFLIFESSLEYLPAVPTATSLVVIISFLIFVGMEVLLTAFHWVAWAMVYEILSSPKMQLASLVDRKFNKS